MSENLSMGPVDIPQNAYETLRVQQKTWQGYQLVDLRVWYPGKEDGEMKPSPKGVTFQKDMLPGVIEALQKMDQNS